MHSGLAGEAIVGGRWIIRHVRERHAVCADLQPVQLVTKRACDLLVAADPSSQSGKVRTARRYGVPLMPAADFLEQAEVDTTDGLQA